MRRRLALALLAPFAPWLLAASAPSTAPAPADERPLRAAAERITLPWVGADELIPAHGVPRGGSRSTIELEVDPPLPGRGWELTVRAEPAGGPVAGGRPPRAFWKLDSEPPSGFRPLREEEQLVLRSESATSGRITIDVVFGVDWTVTPGRHDVGFLFDLQPL